MADINLTLFIILNVSRLNFPNKRQRLEEQIKNMIQETYFRFKAQIG